jgi:hypothetical protein
VRALLGVEVGVRELFARPTVAGLVEALGAGRAPRPGLAPVERPGLVPLSFAQYRLWFLGQWEGASATYNVPVAVRLRGVVDVGALAAALGDVVERHESLRTVFPVVDGQPCQRVVAPPSPESLLRVGRAAPDAVAGLVAEAAGWCFDLAAETPVRAWLWRVGAEESVLLVLLHHIAADGWSMGPLGRDLAVAYDARRRGQAPVFAPLPVQYADYALWQRRLLGEPEDPESVHATQLAWWREALAGMPHTLALPTDRPHPEVAGYRGGVVDLDIDAGLHARLLALARACDATLFMVLQAALAVLLTRAGAGCDIPIGTAVAGRADDQLDDLVGFFVNTLVLRTDTSGQPTFAQLVGRVRDHDLDAFAHQDLPFDQLVEALNPARSTNRHPLFQVMLVLQNTAENTWTLPDLHTTPEPLPLPIARFELLFDARERFGGGGDPAGITTTINYNTDLFDHDTVTDLAHQLHTILDTSATDPDQPAYDDLPECPAADALPEPAGAGSVAVGRAPRSVEEEV